MATIFRRGMASASSSAPSRTASTLPQKVRARRAQFPTTPSLSQRRLPPAQERRFQEAYLAGELDAVLEDGSAGERPGEEDARAQWTARHDEWRSRVRGHNQVLREPQSTGEAGPTISSPTTPVLFEGARATPDAGSLAAHRVYLPNIQIRLMRNHTPPGEPYDPFTATFRIPPSMTKHDLRSYLHAVYGLDVTFIRTDNYVAEVARIGPAGQMRRKAGSAKTYKRAVVGLREPFHYPDDVEELDALIHAADHPPSEGYEQVPRELRIEAALRAKEGKDARQEWLNRNFALEMQAAGRKRSMMKMAKGWRWRAETTDNKVGRVMGCVCLLQADGSLAGQRRSRDHAPETGKGAGDRGCAGKAAARRRRVGAGGGGGLELRQSAHIIHYFACMSFITPRLCSMAFPPLRSHSDNRLITRAMSTLACSLYGARASGARLLTRLVSTRCAREFANTSWMCDAMTGLCRSMSCAARKTQLSAHWNSGLPVSSPRRILVSWGCGV